MRILSIFVMWFVILGINIFGNVDNVTNSILEAGNYKGELMELGIKKEYEEKVNRIKNSLTISILENRDWFNEYVKANEGKELPWHKNFGVSKEDYEFLLKINENFTAVVIKKLDITINTKNEIAKFNHNDKELMTSSLEFDLKRGIALIGEVKFKFDKMINSIEKGGLLGNWTGDSYVAKFKEITDLSQIEENEIYGELVLTMGKSDITNKFLYLKGTLIIEGKPYKVDELIFFDN